MDKAQPWAEAASIAGDKILSVGTAKGTARFKGAGTTVIDSIIEASAREKILDAYAALDRSGELTLRVLLTIFEGKPIFGDPSFPVPGVL